MIFQLNDTQAEKLQQEVADKHGPDWKYVHSVKALGPDNEMGIVDVFSNNVIDPEYTRYVYVLNGKVLAAF